MAARNRQQMHGAGDHELIAHVGIEVAPFSDHNSEKKTQCRLLETLKRREPYGIPPSVELIPQPPAQTLSARFQHLNGFEAVHRRHGIDALPLQIGRIIEAAWI